MAGSLILGGVGGNVVLHVYPQVGALGSDWLRKLVGGAVVTRLEAALFELNDTLADLEYRSGLVKPGAPWQPAGQPSQPPSQGPQTAPAPSRQAQVQPGAPAKQPGLPVTPGPKSSARSGILPAQPTPPPPWALTPVSPQGGLPGEGVWVPYIQGSDGQVVAYKTFLQPDPQRPYALIGVVAIHLEATRLHFVIGTGEPYAQKNPPVRANGRIPAGDHASGRRLAAFNGGFKYAQGHFGAMANGLVSAPPLPGLATVAITSGGQVLMGAWGEDLSPTASYAAWRQNGPLAIRDGKATVEIQNPRYWGFTVTGATATWRSGLALSQDGSTLYYFAGPYLTIHSLTDAMLRVGAWTAMQLDINNYWVQFDAFPAHQGNLAPEPLFPKEMNANTSRFLHVYLPDFFYVTAK